MSDPSSEVPGRSPLRIHVEGAEIPGNACVSGEVGIREGAASGRPLAAELEVFVKDGVQGAASIKRWSCQ